MNNFYTSPILNSPYANPSRHWQLDARGQPTHTIVTGRRRAEYISPIPLPKKSKAARAQMDMLADDEAGLSTQAQQYNAKTNAIINAVRQEVDAWRALKNPGDWQVTPTTARLLQHWRHHEFSAIRPFFCQIEAVETAIWLTEVAPKLKARRVPSILEHLNSANLDANQGLARLALKLATGAGKTTVMAMLIAWQTLNAVRRPQSKKFSRGFLVVAPGLTIRDRLQVLHPNHPESYYQRRELIPADLLPELHRAQIVITNYHAFKRRERVELSKGGRRLLQGRSGAALDTLESEGQMLQRVMRNLMALKNIIVINDEAHHCYREKPADLDAGNAAALKGEDKQEAEDNNAAARLWVSGLEAVQRHFAAKVLKKAKKSAKQQKKEENPPLTVLDLSATPFFLRGSGYVEGTLFPWTMSDFSLMDAIECGIVKLPRVPVADNIPGAQVPVFRNLWSHIGSNMPKKGRGKSGQLDPQALPTLLKTALEALYGHYEKTFALWQEAGLRVPPCFIVVCNNTATSKLVYDYIAGYSHADGTVKHGRLPLFRNLDDHGQPLGRPRTLLIDSQQLESGDALDARFRQFAAPEIEAFRRELRTRYGAANTDLTDQELLREVMGSVGKPGRLGNSVRCVVSVSMLTEGWDASTVTHILGVRAFGSQLLCEQVIGRALRRQSYELNAEGLFDVEYADVLGIPFDFNAEPVAVKPQPPRQTTHICALRERQHLEIGYPRVQGYRVALPADQLHAVFSDDSKMTLTPAAIGATRTHNAGIIGEAVDLTLEHTADMRPATLVFELTAHLLQSHFRDADGTPQLHLFGQLKPIVRQWLDHYLQCLGGTHPAQLKYTPLADDACQRIHAAITHAARAQHNTQPDAMLDPYNPHGSTAQVSFHTSKTTLWDTTGLSRGTRCHLNAVVLDSDWEAEFCRVVESHPRVIAYVKNHNLGFEIPYRAGGQVRHYRPDFIVRIDDGHGADNLLNLIVEIKGYRGEDAKIKRETTENYWLPAVNRLPDAGRWAFAEFKDVWRIETAFHNVITGFLRVAP